MSFVDGAQSPEIYNERVKLFSQTAQNLGVAVTVALFGQLYVVGFDGNIVIAAVIAIFLYATAFAVLGSLEGDER